MSVRTIEVGKDRVIELAEDRRRFPTNERLELRGVLHGIPFDEEAEAVEAVFRALRDYPVDEGFFRFRYQMDVNPRCWESRRFGIAVHIVDLKFTTTEG